MTRDLTVRVLRDLPAIERLAPEWDDLWARCTYATTFQRPEWLLSWLEIFQPSFPVFLEIRSDERLVGIAPLLIYERGSERVLALMGGGVSDYLDVLVDPDLSAEVLTQMHDCIADIDGWDVLELTDLSDNSPLRNFWPNAEGGVVHDACPVLTLPGNAEDLKQVVPPHKLRNLRNARRRLQKAGGGEVEVATFENLETALNAFIHLHEKRWTESAQSGVLADVSVRRFHRCVAPRLLSRGVLRLYTLRFRGRCIAALYAIFEHNVAYCYLQGYDHEFRDLSPGTQILGAVIEDAARLGLPKLDFLRGREEYKYSWGTRDEQTFCVRQQRRAIAAAVRDHRVAA